MQSNISIQLKAISLVIVFGFNMIVGFACAIGVDMNFNTSRHTEAKEIHVHADGKKHHHKKKAPKHTRENGKDNCCNDKVLKIYQADKVTTPTVKALQPVFFIAFTAVYYTIDTFYPSQVTISNKYFVRGHHPPISNIRIAIQRFQI